MSGSISNSNLSTVDSLTQFINATQQSWNQTTVPIPQGLLVYASDTTVVKIGDGQTLYANLPVLFTISSIVGLQNQLNEINTTLTNGTFAPASGNTNQAFSVANALTGNQAVNLTQANNSFASIAGNVAQPFVVGPAIQPIQAPQSSQVATDNLKFATDTSTTVNTITITLPFPTNTLVNGQPFVIQIANTNTGPTKLQILTTTGATVAVLPVQSIVGQLVGGELVASSIWTLRYNSVKKVMVVQGLGFGVFAPIAGNALQPFASAPATQSNQVVTLGQFNNIYPTGSATLVGTFANTPGLSQITVKSPCAGLIFALGCLNISSQVGTSYAVSLSINGTTVASTAGYTSQSVSGVVPVSAGVNTIQVTTTSIQTGSNIMLSVIFIPNEEQAL